MTINTQARLEELESNDAHGEHSEPGDADSYGQRPERTAPNVLLPTVYCPETKIEECLEELRG